MDDEAPVRELLRECFELDGFAVLEAKDGAELKAHITGAAIDLITLDLKLGGENGFDLAREVRASRNLPIIMITGQSDVIDRIVGLELGADDYIAKPFHVREVLARVRAVLRRYEAALAASAVQDHAAPDDKTFSFSDWTLNVGRRELRSSGGQPHELTTAEFNMLLAFVERPARVLSRDNIMDILKGHEWSPFDRSIDSLIVRLRRKVEPNPDTPTLIKTVRGVGYVFAADVRRH